MRAICETCGHVQPPDWKPGDLCGHCGAVVRREKRCHWCVSITPAGKFCRHCGAGLVPDEQFGAARWLKHLGTDQFAIPERLATIDPGQVEHFTRLYQRHAIVAERHVDDLALAEEFLLQRGWARSMDDLLLPQLPLTAEQLRAFTLPALNGTTDAQKLREIEENTPFEATRQLAAIAWLRLLQRNDDATWSDYGPERELSLQALKSDDAALRLEAAIVLSHWRFVMKDGVPSGLVMEALRSAQSSSVEAAVGLALLQARRQRTAQSVPAAALAAEDTDLAFAAALAHHAPDPLHAALRVPMRRFAAAYTLTVMDEDFALLPLVPGFTATEIDDLFQVMAWRQRPRPDLRPFLIAVAQGEYDLAPNTRSTAQELQLLALQPGDAVRLLREKPDSWFIRKLLQTPMPPTEFNAFCHELVVLNLFNTRQISELAALFTRDKLPLSFVPDNFRAAPAASLEGLAALAEKQFETHGRHAAGLHNFLRNTVWSDAAPVEQRQQAWRILRNWYGGNYDDRPALAFTNEAATTYFNSFGDFIDAFQHGLDHLGMLHELEIAESFLKPLREAADPDDPAVLLNALASLPPAQLLRLRAGLVALALDNSPAQSEQEDENDDDYDEDDKGPVQDEDNDDRWYSWNQWAIQMLNQLQLHAGWRPSVRTELESLLGMSGYPVVFVKEALSGKLLAEQLSPAEVLLLVRDYPTELFIRAFWVRANMTPAQELAFCRELLALGLFNAKMAYDLDGLFRRNVLTLSFLLDNYRTALVGSLGGLADFAKYQFTACTSEDRQVLHDFMRAILWDETAAPSLRQHSWQILENWYRARWVKRPELVFTIESATFYFGSFEAFLEDYLHGLEQLTTLKELEIDDSFLQILKEAANPYNLAPQQAALAALPAPLAVRLRAALMAFIIADGGYWSEKASQLLGQIYRIPVWRADTRKELEVLLGSGLRKSHQYEIKQIIEEK